MFAKWKSTVRLLTYSRSATSLLERPSMTSERTSISRLVNLIGSSCRLSLMLMSLIFGASLLRKSRILVRLGTSAHLHRSTLAIAFPTDRPPPNQKQESLPGGGADVPGKHAGTDHGAPNGKHLNADVPSIHRNSCCKSALTGRSISGILAIPYLVDRFNQLIAETPI